MKIKFWKIDYEKCHILWCFRNKVGHLKFLLLDNDELVKIVKVPYCKKHEEMVKKNIEKKFKGKMTKMFIIKMA